MRQVMALLVLLVVTIPLTALSANHEIRPYIAIDGGIGHIDIGDTVDEIAALVDGSASTSKDETSGVYIIGAGIRLAPHLSLEANYYDLGEYEASVTAEGGTITDTIAFTGYGVRLFAHWVITPRWSFDAALGVARMRAERTTSSPDDRETTKSRDDTLTLGIGTQYHISDHWTLRTNLLHMNEIGDSSTGRDSVNAASVGAMLRF